jgi:mannose-1-phosphate guanylyltransferase/mannose-6-phosphate isomerase
MRIIPVILSGGLGTRLWPMSRKDCPKQFLPLVSDKTMLQETILRLNGLNCLEDPIIVCNTEHRFLVAEQCHQINITSPTILLEPAGRNSAPAIAAAALQSIKDISDATLLVLSADHIINNIDAFHQSINIAKDQISKGKLVTFGIVPTHANTGYGYIKSSKENINGSYKVEEFVEKPNQETAKSFLEHGGYLWNSGMFMFKASSLISELSNFAFDIIKSVTDSVDKAKHDLDFIRLEEKAFKSSPSCSIDYALMEKTDNLVVVPLDAEWNDIGSWSVLYDIGQKDSNGNVVKGNVLLKDTSNSYINANNHIITLIGVDNLIVVDTSDATLIASKESVNEVKSIVNSLEKKGIEAAHTNRKGYRPWGWYDSIEVGKYFQVKRLHVKPGAKLSLQLHHLRAEHWIVVIGTATVTNNNQTFTLKKGKSTFIPVGAIHSLANNTNEPLEIIEVQSGSYLGEDDIERFEDNYGRVD